MEDNKDGLSTYRPRTGSMERKKTASAAPKRAVKSADDEERKPRARKEPNADEAPAKRPATRQNFFKSRPTPNEGGSEQNFDEKPKRAPRKSYDEEERPKRAPRAAYGNEEERPKRRSYSNDSDRPAPRRSPSRYDSGDRPARTSSFDKFKGDKPRVARRGEDFKEERGERKPYERKPYGEKSPRGEKSFGERRSFRDDKKPFGDKPRFEKRGEGFKEGDKRPYERKPYGESARGEKNFGERRSFRDDKKPFGDKPRFEKRSEGFREERGDNKHARPYERKPYGEKSSHGEKSFGERRGYSDDNKKPFVRKSYDDENPRRVRTYDSDKPRRTNKKFIEPKDLTAPLRLNKFIANSGVCSRREADEYIENGEITVNGVVITELGTKILPTDEVRWNGDKLSGEKKVYILLNKPKGYVTTVEDEHAAKTVMDLIAGACSERVYPVGRLDKNTTGVLLFTNDGELTKILTHPSYNKRKVYQVTLDKTLKKPDMEKLVEGVELEDGLAVADEVGYTDLEDKTVAGIEIHSGRNRVVRRMFEALGYEVKKLDRVYFAGLTKKSLERGKWRILSPKEISMLKMGAYE